MNTPSLSKDEAIRRIEQLGGEYDPGSSLDVMDQLLICESLDQHAPIKDCNIAEEKGTNENGNDNGSGNGIRKRQENLEETQRKKQAITDLTTCNYRTSPKKIASLLQTVFSSCNSEDGHWLYIAQHYNPKSINSVIHQMTKAHVEGWLTINNPAGYFTDVLKLYHPMRKNRIKR